MLHVPLLLNRSELICQLTNGVTNDFIRRLYALMMMCCLSTVFEISNSMKLRTFC